MVALTLIELRSGSEHRQVRALSSALGGVCILRKGAQVSLYTTCILLLSTGTVLHTSTYTHEHTHIYVLPIMHTYTYIHTYIHIYTYFQTCIHSYIHTYIHTYTYILPGLYICYLTAYSQLINLLNPNRTSTLSDLHSLKYTYAFICIHT